MNAYKRPMWWLKEAALIFFLGVMFIGWNIPSLTTTDFWIGAIAFTLYVCVKAGWHA